jgi:hypothetical protein
VSKSLQFGLVGFGKIARDQHLPAIAGIDGAELVAVASRNAALSHPLLGSGDMAGIARMPPREQRDPLPAGEPYQGLHFRHRCARGLFKEDVLTCQQGVARRLKSSLRRLA